MAGWGERYLHGYWYDTARTRSGLKALRRRDTAAWRRPRSGVNGSGPGSTVMVSGGGEGLVDHLLGGAHGGASGANPVAVQPIGVMARPRQPRLAQSSTAQSSDRHVCSPGDRPITLTRRRGSPSCRRRRRGPQVRQDRSRAASENARSAPSPGGGQASMHSTENRRARREVEWASARDSTTTPSSESHRRRPLLVPPRSHDPYPVVPVRKRTAGAHVHPGRSGRQH